MNLTRFQSLFKEGRSKGSLAYLSAAGTPSGRSAGAGGHCVRLPPPSSSLPGTENGRVENFRIHAGGAKTSAVP